MLVKNQHNNLINKSKFRRKFLQYNNTNTRSVHNNRRCITLVKDNILVLYQPWDSKQNFESPKRLHSLDDYLLAIVRRCQTSRKLFLAPDSSSQSHLNLWLCSSWLENIKVMNLLRWIWNAKTREDENNKNFSSLFLIIHYE